MSSKERVPAGLLRSAKASHEESAFQTKAKAPSTESAARSALRSVPSTRRGIASRKYKEPSAAAEKTCRLEEAAVPEAVAPGGSPSSATTVRRPSAFAPSAVETSTKPCPAGRAATASAAGPQLPCHSSSGRRVPRNTSKVAPAAPARSASADTATRSRRRRPSAMGGGWIGAPSRKDETRMPSPPDKAAAGSARYSGQRRIAGSRGTKGAVSGTRTRKAARLPSPEKSARKEVAESGSTRATSESPRAASTPSNSTSSE